MLGDRVEYLEYLLSPRLVCEFFCDSMEFVEGVLQEDGFRGVLHPPLLTL